MVHDVITLLTVRQCLTALCRDISEHILVLGLMARQTPQVLQQRTAYTERVRLQLAASSIDTKQLTPLAGETSRHVSG